MHEDLQNLPWWFGPRKAMLMTDVLNAFCCTVQMCKVATDIKAAEMVQNQYIRLSRILILLERDVKKKEKVQ